MKNKNDKKMQKTSMEKESDTEMIQPCGLCANEASEREIEGNARKTWRFMTEREFSVLKAMRGLREKAVKIKKRIRRIEKDMETKTVPEEVVVREQPENQDQLWEQEMAEDLLHHCDNLSKLKEQWKQMDNERIAAREERMRLLGHIQ